MGKKVAFITGITGQDGSYLAELLIEKGYAVHGLVRRSSSFNRGRIEHLFLDIHERKHDITLHYGDLGDASSLHTIIRKVKPDEVYHLGAQSHVRVSFDMPEFTGDITGLGTTRILEAVLRENANSKFYQASSSELFGLAQEVPQKETTPFHPRSPYAISKLYAYWQAINYRESYGMFASNGILFNHESPRRGENFVSRKISIGIGKIITGEMDKIYIGNLDALRDWGYAPEYVRAMWLMLQQDTPGDFVIATGESHTIREFLEEAFRLVGITIIWRGEGMHEQGINLQTGKVLVQVDPRYFRPAEVPHLKGDCSKALAHFGWQPQIKFKELVKIMLEADLRNQGIAKTLS